MGSYAKNLFKKNKAPHQNPRAERLIAAAILRDGEVHSYNGTARAHWEVRNSLGDENPHQRNWDDIEGFLTSTGRFVTRGEAKVVGEASGQCRPQGRELLSSDIDW